MGGSDSDALLVKEAKKDSAPAASGTTGPDGDIVVRKIMDSNGKRDVKPASTLLHCRVPFFKLLAVVLMAVTANPFLARQQTAAATDAAAAAAATAPGSDAEMCEAADEDGETMTRTLEAGNGKYRPHILMVRGLHRAGTYCETAVSVL